MNRSRIGLAVILTFALVVAACGDDHADDADVTGGDHQHATGVVTKVEGDLSRVTSFTIRLEDGSDLAFVPEEGILFDGTAPISHLRDHLASGSPVQVSYEEASDGSLVATAIGDAGDDGEHDHEE